MNEMPDFDDPDEAGLREPSSSEIVQLVDTAFASSADWLSVPDRFHTIARSNGINGSADAMLPARRAFRYGLERRNRSGREAVELVPRQMYGDAREASSPRKEASEVVEGWRALSSSVAHPAARARLHDLLVVRGGPATPTHASEAISAYLDLAANPITAIPTDSGDVDVEWRDRDLALSVGRALSLMHIAAAAPDGPQVNAKAIQTALALTAERLHSSVPKVGDALCLLSLLTASRNMLSSDDRRQLAALVDEAIATYADLDHTIDRLAQLAIDLDPTSREAAIRRRVQVRLDIAEKRQGLVAMHFLEQAAKLAEDHQLQDLANEAVLRMQQISEEDMDFATISSNTSLPAEIADAAIRRMSDGQHWREALGNWLAGPPPSGDAATNRRVSEATAQHGVLLNLISSVQLGADNLPRWHVTTPEEKALHRLAQTEEFYLLFMGRHLADALDRIVEEHGLPPLDELALFLCDNGRGNHELARALARSLYLYWNRDFEASLHTSALRVEAAARALVLLLAEPAYRVARTNNPGKYVGLNDLLDLLSTHGFDESWVRFIRTLLLGPAGWNLRHDVAHGFILNEPSRETAALTLRAFALFVVLLWDPAAQLSSQPAANALTDGPSWTITDAVAAFARRLAASPRLAPSLFRHEIAALGSHASRIASGLARLWPDAHKKATTS